MGFIATDYISIIKHYIFGAQARPTKSDAQTSSPTFNINDFKYFKDYDFKEDYKYKRSVFVTYEISET